MDNHHPSTAMGRPARAFDKLFRPRSVAILGASPQRGTPRNTIVRVLQKHGFTGDIFPVSRSADEIEGLRSYKTVGALPYTPDVALIITPAATVPDLLAECGEKGIPAAIIFSSGFEEIESGKELARRVSEIAHRYGITLLGGNCQGLWSVREKTLLTFGTAADNLEKVRHSPVALVSHSGALVGALAAALHRNGIGCSYVVSLGNETCVDLLEVLAWVIEQDDVRVVGLYLEGLNDGGRIVAIAQRAAERGIQIIALKTGRSEIGQAATASHTGKIASSNAVYMDVFEQAGITSVDSLNELLSATEVFAFLPNPRNSDDAEAGLSIISSSGGAAALLADHSDKLSVPLAKFSDDTKEALRSVVPDFGSLANPIDLTGQVRSVATLFRDACTIISRDPRTEALIVQFASSGRKDLANNLETFKQCARDHDIPVVVSLVADTADPDMRADLREAGVLVSNDTLYSMQIMHWLYLRKRMERRPPVSEFKPTAEHAVPKTWDTIMDYLSRSSITPARWTLLKPRESASAACADLAYPLVVKVLPTETDHKTELGLVKLRVGSPEEVDAHAARFREILGKPDADILVQEMVGDGVEVVLSSLGKTDFGPVMAIGTGGTAVELYQDVVHLALPASPEQVERALTKLKLSKLLKGFRGKPPADIDGLVRAAVAFGNNVLGTPGLAEFEINPLIVRNRGEGVVAVDALVVGSDDARV